MFDSFTTKTGYNPVHTLYKGLQIFVFGGIGALIAYLTGLPPTETIVIIIAFLKMLQNYVKNK